VQLFAKFHSIVFRKRKNGCSFLQNSIRLFFGKGKTGAAFCIFGVFLSSQFWKTFARLGFIRIIIIFQGFSRFLVWSCMSFYFFYHNSFLDSGSSPQWKQVHWRKSKDRKRRTVEIRKNKSRPATQTEGSTRRNWRNNSVEWRFVGKEADFWEFKAVKRRIQSAIEAIRAKLERRNHKK
jgi:hypothetical protein